MFIFFLRENFFLKPFFLNFILCCLFFFKLNSLVFFPVCLCPFNCCFMWVPCVGLYLLCPSLAGFVIRYVSHGNHLLPWLIRLSGFHSPVRLLFLFSRLFYCCICLLLNNIHQHINKLCATW